MRAVQVRVGATSANLGPGFDSLGLALDLHDEVLVQVVDQPGVRVRVIGEGSGEVGRGEGHLVVRAVRCAFEAAGVEQPAGLELLCRNAIPHGRGLGSSAAAVVAGLAAGRALARAEQTVDDAALLALATGFEGHPDNAAAALLGAVTIAWMQDGVACAVRMEPHPELAVVLLVPTHRLATHQARSVLPASVSHEDAAATAGRAALLVHALGQAPQLLLPATEDRLHQRQRGTAMPQTLGLIQRLRSAGLAAVVSGAGPSVLVLTTRIALPRSQDVAAADAGPGWRVLTPRVQRAGVVVHSEQSPQAP